MSLSTTTSEKLARDSYFAEWVRQVRALFDQSDEFDLAAEIFSFATAYENEATPLEAYEEFNAWVGAQ